jgi:hypothetical protein
VTENDIQAHDPGASIREPREQYGLICFDLSSFTAMIYSSALGQGTARQIATVDPADMRGLVTT